MAQFGSAPGLGPGGRRFESCHLDHVGTDFAPFRFFFAEKSVTCAVVPPFSQKGTLGSPVRLQARSLTAHCRYHLFARVPAARISFGLSLSFRNGLCSVPIFLCRKISHARRHSSFFAKRHVRLACSLASALSDGSQSLPPFCESACGANIFLVRQSHDVGASFILLALIFYVKNQSSLMPLLLLYPAKSIGCCGNPVAPCCANIFYTFLTRFTQKMQQFGFKTELLHFIHFNCLSAPTS